MCKDWMKKMRRKEIIMRVQAFLQLLKHHDVEGRITGPQS